MDPTHAISDTITPAFHLIPPPIPDAQRTLRIVANISMPLQVQALIGIAEADDPRASQWTLEGAVVLPGVSAKLTFARKSPEETRDGGSIESDVVLIPPGEWFVGATSSPPLRIARNSPLQIHVRDTSGTRLAEACNLGRWDDQPRGFGLSVRVSATLAAEVTTDGRYSSPGSRMTIGGKLIFGRGIVVRCMYGEGGEEWGSRVSRVGKADIVAVEVGQTIQFPDQLVEPSEPTVSLQRMIFRDGRGYPFTPNGDHCA